VRRSGAAASSSAGTTTARALAGAAAFAALHLGVRAVVARSFARIHRTNLIAQAIPPLVLADEETRVEQGDEWRIDGWPTPFGGATRGRRRDTAATYGSRSS
jgi:hypothetical protein